MRRDVILACVLLGTAPACNKQDEALDAVGRAQVLDISAEDPHVAFTAHLERKGVRWVRRTKLERPANKPLLKADPPKGDDSVESPAVDRFLRAVATNRRGATPTAQPASPGTVKITVIGPAGTPPVVLERKEGVKWSVDGAQLADPAPLDASYRAMVTELGIEKMVEWQLSGPAY